MNKNIAIAGVGWLGLPLAQHLKFLGYNVKGSVTSLQKATGLQANDLNIFSVEISEKGVSGQVQALLKDVDCLLILIPPGIRKNTGADHVLKMAHFLEHIHAHNVASIILVSSTSVYNDTQGSVTEKDVPQPTSAAGKQLFQVEQLFFNSGIPTTIVRFGGLFGGSRNPVRYLAGRENLHDGEAPVNLIHRKDCIKIFSEIIKQQAFGHIFNAVNPTHPLKKIYYTQKAEELGLVPPSFSEENDTTIFKKVDSVNLKNVLGISIDTAL